MHLTAAGVQPGHGGRGGGGGRVVVAVRKVGCPREVNADDPVHGDRGGPSDGGNAGPHGRPPPIPTVQDGHAGTALGVLVQHALQGGVQVGHHGALDERGGRQAGWPGGDAAQHSPHELEAGQGGQGDAAEASGPEERAPAGAGEHGVVVWAFLLGGNKKEPAQWPIPKYTRRLCSRHLKQHAWRAGRHPLAELPANDKKTTDASCYYSLDQCVSSQTRPRMAPLLVPCMCDLCTVCMSPRQTCLPCQIHAPRLKPQSLEPQPRSPRRRRLAGRDTRKGRRLVWG